MWLLNFLACFSESHNVGNNAERIISWLTDKSQPEASPEFCRTQSLWKLNS